MRLFALVFLISAAAAQAWGPYTHAALAEALLERIAETKGHKLAFLVAEPYRTTFVRSSLSPDMTLSAFAAKKVDPVYNKLFHDKIIGRAMVQTAWDQKDWNVVAFALGWLSHTVADNRMSKAGGSVIYKDIFGLSKAARKKIPGALNAINKVSLDAFILTEWEVSEVTPHIEEQALCAALKEPIAQRKLAVDAPEDALPGFKRSFDWACSSLNAFCSQLGETKAFPAMIAELTETDGENRAIPGFDEAVEAMDEALVAAIAGRGAGPSARPDPEESKADAPGIVTRTMRRTKALAASGAGFLWGGNSLTKRLRQALLDRSIQLVNSLGSDTSLNGRVMMTFAGDMLNETRTWAEVRAHIQKLVAESN